MLTNTVLTNAVLTLQPPYNILILVSDLCLHMHEYVYLAHKPDMHGIYRSICSNWDRLRLYAEIHSTSWQGWEFDLSIFDLLIF